MKASLQIKIVIPLIPIYTLDQFPGSYAQDAIDELLELDKKLEIEISNLGIFYPSIYFIENYNPIFGKYKINSDAIVFEILIPNKYKNRIILTTRDF